MKKIILSTLMAFTAVSGYSQGLDNANPSIVYPAISLVGSTAVLLSIPVGISVAGYEASQGDPVGLLADLAKENPDWRVISVEPKRENERTLPGIHVLKLKSEKSDIIATIHISDRPANVLSIDEKLQAHVTKGPGGNPVVAFKKGFRPIATLANIKAFEHTVRKD